MTFAWKQPWAKNWSFNFQDPCHCVQAVFMQIDNQNLSFSVIISLLHHPNIITSLKKKALENIVGKGENAGNQHFLLFPHCFLTYFKTEFIILTTFIFLLRSKFGPSQNFVVQRRITFCKNPTHSKLIFILVLASDHCILSEI